MATTAEPGASLIGASIRRKEDPRFITGKGRYTDDVKFPGQTYAAFVRSPVVRARILSTRLRRISAANIGPNLFHQKRTVSWLISMPRSCSRSSTLRSDSGNRM